MRGAGSSGSSSGSPCRGTPRPWADTSFGLTPQAWRAARAGGEAALPTLGCVQARPRGPRRLRPARALRVRAGAAGRAPVACLSEGGASREIVRPHETQAYVGNLVARQKGEGIEFADLRLYQPGDRVRRVNWKATARRGALVVNEEHPERNSATVLLLDSFAEARLGRGRHARSGGPGDCGARGRLPAPANQVGLLSFGGSMNWLEPALGAFSSTGSSRRCSTPRSCSRTCGGTSASSPRTSCRPRRSCSASRRCSTSGWSAPSSTCAGAAPMSQPRDRAPSPSSA